MNFLFGERPASDTRSEGVWLWAAQRQFKNYQSGSSCEIFSFIPSVHIQYFIKRILFVPISGTIINYECRPCQATFLSEQIANKLLERILARECRRVGLVFAGTAQMSYRARLCTCIQREWLSCLLRRWDSRNSHRTTRWEWHQKIEFESFCVTKTHT